MSRVDNTLSFTADRSRIGQSVELGYRDEKPVVKKRRQLHHQKPGARFLLPLQETNQVTSSSHEGLLVGALDRYSLGDLLMPHVVSRLIHLSRLRCAGLVSSDFTPEGGHAVRNYGESAVEMVGKNLKLIHVGGETLSRNLTSGYAMAARGGEAERFESLMQIGDQADLTQFVRRRTGQVDDFAYVLASSGQFHGARSCFHSVGLSDPGALSDSSRLRLVEILKGADFVGVRDKNGAQFLERQGVDVERMPCGLTVLPLVCGRPLQEARVSAAMEDVKSRFPNGWMAVDTSRISGRDFDLMVAALGSVAEKDRVGIVFFEATDEGVGGNIELKKWVEAFRENKAMAFDSRNIWEVSSLIIHSRLYCGSSLNSRIIAMAAGIPRINVPIGQAKVKSYCELWEHDAVPVEFDREEGDWAGQLRSALKLDPSVLQQHTVRVQAVYFKALEKLCRRTGMTPKLIVPGREGEMTDHFRANQFGKEIADEWARDEESRHLLQRVSRRRAKLENGGRSIVRNAIQKALEKVKS